MPDFRHVFHHQQLPGQKQQIKIDQNIEIDGYVRRRRKMFHSRLNIARNDRKKASKLDLKQWQNKLRNLF
jgi:hypothetical protein